MSTSFTFHVTNRSGSDPLQLTGTNTQYPGIHVFKVVSDTTDNGTFKTSGPTAVIHASSSHFQTLSTAAVPFNMILVVEDPGTGTVTLDEIDLGGLSLTRRMVSDVKELSGKSASNGELVAHEASSELLGELRKLNRSVATIEKLLLEAREQAGLPRTGTDDR
jgi:hypothetical protein